MRERLAPYPAPGGHSPCTAGGCTPARRLHGAEETASGAAPPRPPHLPGPPPPLPPAPYLAYASFGSRTSEPRNGSRRPGDTLLDYREGWGLGWAWGDPEDQRVPAQSQGPERQSCSHPRVAAGSSAVGGQVKEALGEGGACVERELTGTVLRSWGWGLRRRGLRRESEPGFGGNREDACCFWQDTKVW